jgi:hypothetical protein
MIHKILWASLFLILIIMFVQCTSRYSQSDADNVLSTERVSAKTSPISFLIPHSWRVIDANDSTFIDLWLISDDYSSSLSLIPLHTENTNQNLSEWIEVSKLSNEIKFRDENIKIIDDGSEEINEVKTASYHFKNKKSLHRISLFKFKGKFYELTALDKNPNHDESSQIEYLIKFQSAFISSIK